MPAEKVESFGSRLPIGRAGQPAELAPAYVFLASQESSYITAQVLGVTGGFPARLTVGPLSSRPERGDEGVQGPVLALSAGARS